MAEPTPSIVSQLTHCWRKPRRQVPTESPSTSPPTAASPTADSGRIVADGDFRCPKYTRALVRQIPNSIRTSSEGRLDYSKVKLARARKEHSGYVRMLRDLGLNVTVLPADEQLPDCPFVEDCCVVVGNRALITRPPKIPRRKEVDIVERCLKKLGLEVHRIEDRQAILEGGDVLFTGREFFAGNSIKSNLAGHRVLAETFPEYPVHSIPIEPPEFHLKGALCMAAPGKLVVPSNKWGQVAWEEVCKQSKYTYTPIWVPCHFAVNCMHINGTVVHCTQDEYPKSCKILTEELSGYNRIERSIGELGKVGAGLTCCSVLF